MRHVDTASAARDIDRVRRALGDDRINYLGLSYGVQLGTQYAELFPSRIRTMALDGVLVHSLSPVQLFADEASSYESTLDRFFAWCGRDTSCALHGRDVARLFDRLVARADRTPLPAPGCADGHCRRTVTGEDIRFHAEDLLLFKKPIPNVAPEGWNAMALALKAAAAGDATAFSSPRAVSPTDDGASGAPLAIECLDWRNVVHNLGDLRRLALLGETVAPHLGGASQAWTVLSGCVGRPAPVVNPPHPTRVTGTPRLLLVNATHDPSTPYVWAQQLASEVRRSVLLTREGDGHTSYLVHGPSRTRDAIDRYLITGRTPPQNTVFRN
jgi:pimeloyl-ACP methyl ester carboxylesterase